TGAGLRCELTRLHALLTQPVIPLAAFAVFDAATLTECAAVIDADLTEFAAVLDADLTVFAAELAAARILEVYPAPDPFPCSMRRLLPA
ncbi:hypothetical protein AeNC1_018349, partial [Aphanomyces euteiches]